MGKEKASERLLSSTAMAWHIDCASIMAEYEATHARGSMRTTHLSDNMPACILCAYHVVLLYKHPGMLPRGSTL